MQTCTVYILEIALLLIQTLAAVKREWNRCLPRFSILSGCLVKGIKGYMMVFSHRCFFLTSWLGFLLSLTNNVYFVESPSFIIVRKSEKLLWAVNFNIHHSVLNFWTVQTKTNFREVSKFLLVSVLCKLGLYSTDGLLALSVYVNFVYSTVQGTPMDLLDQAR